MEESLLTTVSQLMEDTKRFKRGPAVPDIPRLIVAMSFFKARRHGTCRERAGEEREMDKRGILDYGGVDQPVSTAALSSHFVVEL